MAKLVLLQGGESKSYDLSQDETVLGRHPDCTIQLESNMVSRKHARVVKEDGKFFVEDLGSGNGTLLNGQKLTARVPIQHEDRIKLGPMLLRFESAAPAAGARKPFAAGGEQPAFKLDLAGDDGSTIQGSVGSSSRFGALTVKPEVKLKAVLDIAATLAGSTDLPSLLPKILDTLFKVFPQADRGSILLKDETGKMVPRAIKHRRPGEDESVKLSKTILNKVLSEKTGILSADAANDARFNASESISNFTIRSMMCVPLLGIDGEPMGVINVDTQNPIAQFQPEDLDILVAVAGQAALSYESARLLVTYMEKMKQDGEMEIARGVQRALLPEELPQVPGYEFYAAYEAAQAVGGDYYDCMLLDDGKKVCLAFGDVAGKGVPGALVMSRLSSCVRATMEFVSQSLPAVERINNHMCAKMAEGRFVTFVITIIDLETHDMSIVNAGHMSPMIRKPDGTIEEFGEETVGLPIGVVEGFPYEVVERTLEPGETVVIYTDGVSEAMNAKSALFSVEKIRELVTKGPPAAGQLGPIILSEVKKHAGGHPQNDDITLMAFGRQA